MKYFTNPIIKKENEKHYRGILISLILIVLGILAFLWASKVSEEAFNNIENLHDVILSKDGTENILAFIENTTVPLRFAGMSGEDNAYYLVRDDNYIYVVYMSNETYDSLKDENIYQNGTEKKTLVGVTALVPTDVKKIAVDVTNKLWPDDPITLADYNNYYGSVYLDLTQSSEDVSWFQEFLGLIFLGSGLICLIVNILSIHRYQKNIKKLSREEIADIDMETLDKDSFYYSNLHLYLTPNYIVLMARTFKVIKYSDILWLYEYEQKVNGIKSSKSIMITTKDGKLSNLVTIPAITKKRAEMYDEIFKTIAAKNPNILIGYTPENNRLVKENLQNLKKSNKIENK